MKQIFLIFSSFLFIGSTFAELPNKCFCNPLIEIMVDETPFTHENIQSSKPIYAHRIEIQSGQKTAYHFAYYLGGQILTSVSENASDYGLQRIFFYENYINGAFEESLSYSWKVERFNGKKYVVHFHDGFCVYSSKDSQFVISN